jgi:metallo-beta-lactamase class B
MSARKLATLPLLLAACAPAEAEVQAPPASQWTASCEDWDDWDKPGPPFRIHGNSYYVGTCGIGAILIDTGTTLVVIDSGTQAGADGVLANLRSLGLDLTRPIDILQSHEHFDHVGGLAQLGEALSARIVINQDVLDVYLTGQADPRDPQAGMHEPMRPVSIDQVSPLRPGASLDYDGYVIQSIATPGHTPGALSWQWESCDEAGLCRSIVYADSMSAISKDGYRFSDHPEYIAAYRAGIAQLAAADCDILLTPHPSASGMREKLIAGDLASGTTCRDYAASITQRLDTRLAEEAATQ